MNVGLFVFSFYLRQYQASSPMMRSSRDTTSTVGRMCWLEDVTSSEGGEAGESRVRQQCRHRGKQEGEGGQRFAERTNTQLHLQYNVGTTVYCDEAKINTWLSTALFSSTSQGTDK